MEPIRPETVLQQPQSWSAGDVAFWMLGAQNEPPVDRTLRRGLDRTAKSVGATSRGRRAAPYS
jgi:hypothetical protein